MILWIDRKRIKGILEIRGVLDLISGKRAGKTLEMHGLNSVRFKCSAIAASSPLCEVTMMHFNLFCFEQKFYK